jgi:mannose-6-phosphate isomerase-like protein (cupin superfamily)
MTDTHSDHGHEHGGGCTATPTVQVDDDRVRITRWDFRPGEATGWHRHGMPYVVVPIVDGILKIVDATGEKLVPLAAGASYARPLGVEHDVINAGPGTMSFVEIEMKS